MISLKKIQNKIKCQLCDKELRTITASHLLFFHNGMSVFQYKKLFPKSPLHSKEVIKSMKKSAIHRHRFNPLSREQKKRISQKMKSHWKNIKGG